MVVMATGAVAAEIDAETQAVINNACSGAVSAKPFCGKNRGSLNYLACMQAESKIGEEIYNNKYGALSTEAVGRFGIGVKKVVGWGAVIHSFNLFTQTLTPDQTDTLIYILSLPWQAKYGVGWMIIRGQVAGTGEWSKSISAGYVVRSVMETLNTVSKPLPPDYKLFWVYFSAATT